MALEYRLSERQRQRERLPSVALAKGGGKAGLVGTRTPAPFAPQKRSCIPLPNPAYDDNYREDIGRGKGSSIDSGGV